VRDKLDVEPVVPEALPLGVARLPASSTVTAKLVAPVAAPPGTLPLHVVFATAADALAVHGIPALVSAAELVKLYKSALSTDGSPPVETYVSGKQAPPVHPVPCPYARACTAFGGFALTASA
jgi:hypothetical protein